MDIIAQVETLAMHHPVVSGLMVGACLVGAAILARYGKIFLKIISKDFSLEFKAEDPRH